MLACEGRVDPLVTLSVAAGTVDQRWEVLVAKGAMAEPDEFGQALADTIDALRGVHGVSQEAIADAIGRTQPYVSERVRRRLQWSTNDLTGIAGLFRMSPFELVAAAGRRYRAQPRPSDVDPYAAAR
jgi:hypothetical protein